MAIRIIFLLFAIQNVLIAGEPDLAFPVFTERLFENIFTPSCSDGKEGKSELWCTPGHFATDVFEGNDTLAAPEGKYCLYFQPEGHETEAKCVFMARPASDPKLPINNTGPGNDIVCDFSVFHGAKVHIILYAAEGQKYQVNIKGGGTVYTGTGKWEEKIYTLDVQTFKKIPGFEKIPFAMHSHHMIVEFRSIPEFRHKHNAPLLVDDIYFFKGDYYEADLTTQ